MVTSLTQQVRRMIRKKYAPKGSPQLAWYGKGVSVELRTQGFQLMFKCNVEVKYKVNVSTIAS